MTRSRLHLLVGTLALILGGAASGLSRIVLGASLDSCVGAPDGTTQLALRLRLLVPSALCPPGLFGPGPTVVEALEITVMLASSVLVAGLLLVLSALGAQVTVRRVLRDLRDWVLASLAPPLAPATVTVEARRSFTPPAPPLVLRDPAGRPHRRGPPASCSA